VYRAFEYFAIICRTPGSEPTAASQHISFSDTHLKHLTVMNWQESVYSCFHARSLVKSKKDNSSFIEQRWNKEKNRGSQN
jgi:hypothetical protein